MKAFERNVYYLLKPVIPWRVRLALRRWSARRLLPKVGAVWPVKPGSDQPPQGWQGWPKGKQFSFVLTHDVESQKGVDRVRQLAEMEMACGFRSSYNFIPEGPYRVPVQLRRWLVDNGFEVGVHDHRHDGKLFRSWRRFKTSAGRINHFLRDWNAVGFRAGFMLHNLEWIRELGVLYDASTFDTDPFEPQPDGVDTIFPFIVPRPSGAGYVELPYTLVQDFNLFIVLRQHSIDIWKQKLDWIASRGGMALLIVHPDYTSFSATRPTEDEFPASLYEEFLRYVRNSYSGSSWSALPREVAEHVVNRKGLLRTPASDSHGP